MLSSGDIISILLKNGWVQVSHKGSHRTFKSEDNQNLVTVVDPRKDNPIGYIRKLEKVTGLKFR